MNKHLKLYRIKQILEEKNKFSDTYIYVPSVWKKPLAKREYTFVQAGDYYHGITADILKRSKAAETYSKSLSVLRKEKDRWASRAVIYNAFPRLTAAFDHDGNNVLGSSQIDMTLNEKGIRDCGTFLKMIAMLPYIQTLGADTLYLLPVNRIGKDARKGNLGSPYATSDLLAFDERLGDPLLGGMAVEDQFAALVEAAHILGIRVILEFALRTSAPDNVNAKEHPEWFYWIRREDAAGFSKPVFTPEELEKIKRIPEGGKDYIAPDESYREQFVLPPKKGKIGLVKDKFVADSPQGEAVIPPAFADWPPDDIQPSWDDVTYLRMYRDGQDKYNYTAYNTLRYYDPKLAREANINASLWEYLSDVIPTYQKKYGIDGSMIDMGHAIPKKLVESIQKKAHEIDPAFAFFEENFYPTGKTGKKGYDAALGFGFECDFSTLYRMVDYARREKPEPVFGTLETHNTPRAAARGGARFSKAGYAVFAFLPSVIPVIHSGFELLETFPVNTGLGFTQDQSDFYAREKLPLFNVGGLNWLAQDSIIDFIARVNALRAENLGLVCDTSEASLDIPHVESPGGKILAYRRINPKNPREQIVVAVNTDPSAGCKFYMHVPYAGDRQATDIVSGFTHTFTSDWLSYDMEPGQVIVLKLEGVVSGQGR